MDPYELIDLFNARFMTEWGLPKPPLTAGEFGVEADTLGIRITTRFRAVRPVTGGHAALGYAARLEANQHANVLQTIAALSAYSERELAHIVVAFDRLCRTVHVLNFLWSTPGRGKLFLPVNPLHILGVKANHGSYFEEILTACGVQPSRTVLVVDLKKGYACHTDSLLAGMTNYRTRGYRIAVRFDTPLLDKQHTEFLRAILPDFTVLPAAMFQTHPLQGINRQRLVGLVRAVHSLDGHTILDGVNDAVTGLIAVSAGIDYVQGRWRPDATSTVRSVVATA